MEKDIRNVVKHWGIIHGYALFVFVKWQDGLVFAEDGLGRI